MLNSSELFCYTTICSSFKFPNFAFFEFLCTDLCKPEYTHTMHRQTNKHEYPIVSVLEKIIAVVSFFQNLAKHSHILNSNIT